MDEVSLDTLLLGGECDVQWGTQGSSTVHRTIEIHTNNLLYCFDEPKNSMAKHAKEKVYLEGCHVVDGGAYSGEDERLLLFLVNYDYAEKVDLLGNRRAYIFAPGKDSQANARATTAELPGADYAVQLFMTDKMLKWRLLQAIQRASQEYSHLFSDSPTGNGLAGVGALGGGGRASFAHANVPNRFESEVLYHAPPVHTRQSSDISVLSDHEVLQLSDVLREYDAMQQQQQQRVANASLSSPLVAQEDVRKAAAVEEVLDADEEACLPDNIVDSTPAAAATASSFASAMPVRLQHSPLYDSCICSEPANQMCADCEAAFPSWCLLQPFGAFVCIECIGVHRKLWSNKCRGAELDLWPAADIAFMHTRGNAVVNAELEYYVAFPEDSVEAALRVDPPVKPVAAFSSVDVRESYIQWKYDEQLFTQRRHPSATQPLPPCPDPVGLEQSRLSAASSGAAVTATTAAAAARDGQGCANIGLHTSPTQQQRALLRDDGPPRYTGLLNVVVKELVGPESITGAVCVLTNGFQTLRTHVSRQLLHMHHSTAWDAHLQLGIESAGRKPIYCTVYRGRGELLATGEVWLKEEVFRPGTSSMFAVALTWSQLHKRASQRNATEQWEITFLTSYQMLL
ncbi:putative GTP-ase activating protein [Leptomonas pyrrhocoris]|uniref:Putative GTP-ase activating protein n=1 Tax=Leptomonas pyrrhocoris TaxID=157538 RepID=A0A0N0VHP0_LEPPY|nr:putative GTP-ase activating protein [Leptomonas pyrrhocoris]KPA85874.1 putative GTP-ase activating protein [Leptomonas pyrrhocoris]|eukprot:XP_015664313.1 putative GTP-ase activating protein [Leptomonas pyrrhocoris]